MLDMFGIEPVPLVICKMSLTLIQLSYQVPSISEMFFAIEFTYVALEIYKYNLFWFDILDMWGIEPMPLETCEMALTLIQLSYQVPSISETFFCHIIYFCCIGNL